MALRSMKTLLAAMLLTLVAGCVDGTSIITLNPDGRGKAEIDVIEPGQQLFGFAPKDKNATTPERLNAAVAGKLTNPNGITAWKDVKAEWRADGRMHFTATFYFDKLDDVKDAVGANHQVAIDKDGAMRITSTPKRDDEPMGRKLPEFATLNDKQFDDFILGERITYQSTLPIIRAMLADLKYKTTIVLPGAGSDVKGFKATGKQTVAYNLDGNALLADIRKFMEQDNAALKKVLLDAKTQSINDLIGSSVGFGEGLSLTVKKPERDLFDYDKEVKEARAAYPQLRTKFKIPDDMGLPGDGKKPALPK